MPKAPSRCGPKCPNKIVKYGKCSDHQPVKVAWQGSNRQSEFFKSAEWQRQRRRIIFRDKGNCQLCGKSNSKDVDHIIPVWFTGKEQVDDHELQLLCYDCHKAKSSFEGVQAKRIKRASKPRE